MCCRYLLLRDDLRDLLARLGVPDAEGDVADCAEDFADKYNIAPCSKIPVVRTRTRAAGSERECVSLIWNFAASGRAASPKPPRLSFDVCGALGESALPAANQAAIFRRPLFNARAESLWDKPAFREAARVRRCLIPASGFYEWEGRARLPWLFQLRDAEPFFMAGIWVADTCAIITTEANALMQPIHDRMPAIIAAADVAAWLDDEERARLLLSPFAAERLTARRVSTYVNNARNEGVACVADAASEDEGGTLPLF